MDLLHGSCLCGGVAFEARPPSLWVAHCHCSMCRRAHGAPVVTWVGLSAASVEVRDGGDRLTWYASSPGAERGFCGRCGSPMFFRAERWPGELHVARALFHGEVDRAPQVHVFWDTHVDWLALGEDGLKRVGDPKS